MVWQTTITFLLSLSPVNHKNTYQTPKQIPTSFFKMKYFEILPLTYCLHLNAILDSSKLQIWIAASGICSCRYSYSITALELNLFSALSGFTSHADKPPPLDIHKRRTFCGRDTSNSLLARRKLCFPMC